MIDLYVYSDESGVLDKRNNYFIFSGIVFLNRIDYENASRTFYSIESSIKKDKKIYNEMKGSFLLLKQK